VTKRAGSMGWQAGKQASRPAANTEAQSEEQQNRNNTQHAPHTVHKKKG